MHNSEYSKLPEDLKLQINYWNIGHIGGTPNGNNDTSQMSSPINPFTLEQRLKEVQKAQEWIGKNIDNIEAKFYNF